MDLNNLAKELWLRCMERSIHLKAQHLAGVLNTIADDESIGRGRLETVSSSVPSDQPEAATSGGGLVCQHTDSPTADICQLQTRPNGQCHGRVHSGLGRTQSIRQPSVELIGRILAQTRQQQAELVLVAPVWKAQGWYPVLLEMWVKIPLLIPQGGNLITATQRDSLPEVVP